MSLVVCLDNSVAQSGFLLNGYFSFTCNKQLSGTQLVATLEGEEKTCVRYTRTRTDRDGRSHTETHYARSYRSIIRVNIPINNNDQGSMIQFGKINPGSYTMPFTIQLPTGLPSSMRISHGGSDCCIRYQIRAAIKGSGKLWNYHCNQDIIIHAEPPASSSSLSRTDINRVPYYGDPKIETVSFCCCFNKGQMAVAAYVEDTDLHRGQTIMVAMSCKNRSTARIEAVTATIKEHVRWYAGGHSEVYTQHIASLNYGDATGNPVAAGEKQDSVGKINPQQDFPSMLQEIRDMIHSGQITLPISALDSYSGQLIQVRHVLEIKLQTSCCINSPCIQIPIQSRPPLSDNNQIQQDLYQQQQQQPIPSAPPTKLDNPTPIGGGEYGSINANNNVTPASAPPAKLDNNNNNNGFVNATPIYVPASNFKMGGEPSAPYEHENNEPDIPVVAASVIQNRAPSIDNLLLDMKSSVNEYALINERIKDSSWKCVIESTTPIQYGRIIHSVTIEFDQGKVAEIIAQTISPNFTCSHIVEGLKSVAEWNRSSTVEKLLPYCNDLSRNKEKIYAVLSDWDRTVTKTAFDNALKDKK